MRKRTVLILEPDGWPVHFRDCRPGFFTHNKYLCLKSEYGDCEAFVESGEYFWGGTDGSKDAVLDLIVQPVTPKWEEIEE